MDRQVNGRSCAMPTCSRQSRSRGWCDMHYRRSLRHGSPWTPGGSYRDREEAFLGRTEPLPWSGCLIWTGSTTKGYGTMTGGTYAHRYAWEREHGSVPEGMVVDHRYHCSTLCCEVSHLRLASAKQNQENRAGATSASRTGVRGVVLHGSGYGARVTRGGREHWLGTFPSLEEAEFAAVIGRARLHDYHSPADLEYLTARGLSVDSIKAGDYGPSYRLTPSDFDPYPQRKE